MESTVSDTFRFVQCCSYLDVGAVDDGEDPEARGEGADAGLQPLGQVGVPFEHVLCRTWHQAGWEMYPRQRDLGKSKSRCRKDVRLSGGMRWSRGWTNIFLFSKMECWAADLAGRRGEGVGGGG